MAVSVPIRKTFTHTCMNYGQPLNGIQGPLGIFLFHILALGGEPGLQCGERLWKQREAPPEEVDPKGREESCSWGRC